MPRPIVFSYIYFAREQRPILIENNPDMIDKEASELMRKMWKDLVDKSKYTALAFQDMQRYKLELEQERYMTDGDNSEDDEDSEDSEDGEDDNEHVKYHNDYYLSRRWEVLTILNKTHKVIKPVSAYLLFTKDQRQIMYKNNPDISFQELTIALGAAWRNLTDRSEYIDRAEKDKKSKNRQEMLVDVYKECAQKCFVRNFVYELITNDCAKIIYEYLVPRK